MQVKVGNIFKLKVECLNNPTGTEGVVYYHYNDGFQVIFPNGNYDGFSLTSDEADYFLEYVGHSKAVENYEFKNVMQLMKDFHKNYFFK